MYAVIVQQVIFDHMTFPPGRQSFKVASPIENCPCTILVDTSAVYSVDTYVVSAGCAWSGGGCPGGGGGGGAAYSTTSW